MKAAPVASLAVALLSGCGPSSVDSVPFHAACCARSAAWPPAGTTTSGNKIAHVVVIVQENRSFDNLFHGYPGANTQAYGYASDGKKVMLQPVSLATTWDIQHNSTSFFAACDGRGPVPGTHCKMDGFDREPATCGGVGPPCPYAHPMYGYVPHDEIGPYLTIAKRYVLADEMFASNFDGSSFISHQYLIAGQASSTVDYPNGGLWGCDGGPSDTIATLTPQRAYAARIQACFENQTLGDELDAAGVSWRYYTSGLYRDGNLWNAYQAIGHIRYGPDWKADVIQPQTRFFDDVRRGRLPAVSWVTPTCENSDHAGCDSTTGPDWVASLVNAVGSSRYWKTSAIFIMWDDFGGWYDHVAPPYKDFDGLGIRVPLLIVSPYAKKGYVSHVHYEHGSLLRFIEDRFGLQRLAATDARATSPQHDAFDFGQPPRAFRPIPSKHDVRYFVRQPLDTRPVDSE